MWPGQRPPLIQGQPTFVPINQTVPRLPWNVWRPPQQADYAHLPQESIDWAALAKQWMTQKTQPGIPVIGQQNPVPPPPVPSPSSGAFNGSAGSSLGQFTGTNSLKTGFNTVPPPPPSIEPLQGNVSTIQPPVTKEPLLQVSNIAPPPPPAVEPPGSQATKPDEWNNWEPQENEQQWMRPPPPPGEDSQTSKETFDYGHQPVTQQIDYNHQGQHIDYQHGAFDHQHPPSQSHPQRGPLLPTPAPYWSGPPPPPHGGNFEGKAEQMLPYIHNFQAGNESQPNGANMSPYDNMEQSMETTKRRTLPAWIRQGLENFEREKQRKIEAEKQEAEKLEAQKQRELAEKEEEEELRKSGIDPGNARVPRKSRFDEEESNDEVDEGHGKNVAAEVDHRKPDASEKEEPEAPPMTAEERQEDLIKRVRRMMTEVLLAVTTQEINAVANEVFVKAMRNKSKAPARQIAKSTALASLTNLGLGYGSDSDSDTGANNPRRSGNSSSDDTESDSDSEERLEKRIKKRRRDFAKKMVEIEQELEEQERQAQIYLQAAASMAEESCGKKYSHIPGLDNSPPPPDKNLSTEDKSQSNDDSDSSSDSSSSSQTTHKKTKRKSSQNSSVVEPSSREHKHSDRSTYSSKSKESHHSRESSPGKYRSHDRSKVDSEEPRHHKSKHRERNRSRSRERKRYPSEEKDKDSRRHSRDYSYSSRRSRSQDRDRSSRKHRSKGHHRSRSREYYSPTGDQYSSHSKDRRRSGSWERGKREHYRDRSGSGEPEDSYHKNKDSSYYAPSKDSNKKSKSSKRRRSSSGSNSPRSRVKSSKKDKKSSKSRRHTRDLSSDSDITSRSHQHKSGKKSSRRQRSLSKSR